MQRTTVLPPGFEDLRGKPFKDRYEITDLVDAGARRVLFAGQERETQRPILLRIIRPLAPHDEPTVTRFSKRITAAGRVRHPVVHAPLDSGEIFDGTLWAAYERPAGKPLLEALADAGGRFAWADARAPLLELVQGLAAAHAGRVVHGALYPSCGWLDRPAQSAALSLRLIDLGANAHPSLEDQSLESSRTINLGDDTVFIAPETAGVSMGDQRSDVYLVGLLAYLLLTGRPPFEGGNAFKVMAMHMDTAVPPMQEFGADVPPAVEDLVRVLLAKEPNERPEGMARVEQLILGLDEDGLPQEVPLDDSAQGSGRRGRGRAKRGQSSGPAQENPRQDAIARPGEQTPSSSSSSLHRMLPGQEIMAPATPGGALRSAHGASSGAAAAIDRPTVAPQPVAVALAPVAMPIATPTPSPSDPFPADGGTLLLQGNAPALLDAPLPADGGTLLLQGNAPALLDASLPADGGTLLLQGNTPVLPADGGTLLLAGNASAPIGATMKLSAELLASEEGTAPEATLMLAGGGSAELLEGTMRLGGRPESHGSEPVGSTSASTVQLPSSGADGQRGGTAVVARPSSAPANDARSTAVAPRRVGTDTARASASTAGTTKPSASSSMRRESQSGLQNASPGSGSQVWIIALTVLAVVAGVAAGWLL